MSSRVRFFDEITDLFKAYTVGYLHPPRSPPNAGSICVQGFLCIYLDDQGRIKATIMSGDSVLPSGWYEGVDPNFKRPYFYNKRTRRSTWTKPTYENEKALIAKGEAREIGKGTSTLGNTHLLAKHGTSETESKISESTPKKEWVEVYSPEHKRTYFFNRHTKESRWTNPETGEEWPVTEEQGASEHSSSMETVEEDAIPVQARSAWLEIEAARKELQKERQRHTEQMREEWKILQAQIQELRALTIGNAFTPSNTPSDINLSEPKPRESQEVPEPAAVNVNINIDVPKQQEEEKVEADSGTYTAGLLSELEEYADSLMKRRETINKFGESKSVERETGEVTDDSEDDDYLKDLLGEVNESSPRSKNRKGGKPQDALIPLGIEAELEDLNSGFRAVKAEADAVKKAHEEIKELDENGFYALLEVSPEASPVQLKKAYYKAMMKWHPDKYRGEEKDDAHKKSYQVGQAYGVLSDPFQRQLYDIMGVEQYLVHKNVMQCFVNFLNTGTTLRKHPRKKYTSHSALRFIDRQNVRKKVFWLSADAEYICTGKKLNLEPSESDLARIKRVKITDINNVTKGIKTEVLEVSGVHKRENRYISIHYNGTTLDLEAPQVSLRDFLHSRLTLLAIHTQQNIEWFRKFHESRKRKRKSKKNKDKKRRSKRQTKTTPRDNEKETPRERTSSKAQHDGNESDY